MKFTMLYQDPETDGRGCPSLYLEETGKLAVQGPEADIANLAVLEKSLQPSETAVRVSCEVMIRGIEQYMANTQDKPPYQDSAGNSAGGKIIYLADTDDFIVRGQKLDAADLGKLVSVLPHETAVRVLPEVALRAVEQYQASR